MLHPIVIELLLLLSVFINVARYCSTGIPYNYLFFHIEQTLWYL